VAAGLQFAVLGLVLAAAACSKPGASNDSGADPASELTDANSVIRIIETRPEGRSLVPTMRQAFPAELQQIGQSYVERTRAATAQHTQIADFPNQEFKAFISAKQAALARAPDADLLKIRRAMADVGRAFTDEECRATDADPNGAAPEALREMEGRMMTAAILAERAGIDHPVDRQLSPAQSGPLLAKFTAQLPDGLRVAVQRKQLSPGQQCELAGALLSWIGGLPDKDAIQLMATGHPGV
jgi:hypothetical protein